MNLFRRCLFGTLAAILCLGTGAATQKPSVITQPDWLRRPTGEEMASYYPKIPLAVALEGAAILSCSVSAQGRLEDCTVPYESPAGAGFGAAALRLGRFFQMRP